MKAFLIGLLVVFASLVALWKELARLSQLPAQELPDGTGHLMVHALEEKARACGMALLVTVSTIFGIYLIWRDGNWGAGLYVFVLCAIAGWPTAHFLRRVRNRVELTDVGITQRRGALQVFIPWSEVTKITEAPWPNTLNIRGRDGTTLQLDKLLVGRRTVLEYMRVNLPPHLYQAAFSYLLPQTALRQRVEAARRSYRANRAHEEAPHD